MSTSEPRRLLVIGSLALAAIPAAGRHEHLVVEDVASGKRLGEAIATVTPFEVDGKLVLAGPQERQNHQMTVIVTPADDGSPYPVKKGGWMTPPMDVPSGPITMIAQDRDGVELFRVSVQPDAQGKFRPAFGPDWVGYVPLDD